MEDIYDNLENYDDLNKIHELKNENKELKCKIEKYTAAIDKLQKNILQDFDKLAAEHKKLELNYSSLLKTAKAEIERKTYMIKELNIEKDKLVLNSRLNKNTCNKFRRSERLKPKNWKGSESSNIQSQSGGRYLKSQRSQNECKSAHSLPSLDSVSTCNADVQFINDDGNKNVNHESRNCSAKEKDMQVLKKLHKEHTETKVKKIMNRRKSLPAISHDIKFSSDEEYENSAITEENKTHCQPRADTVKRVAEKRHHSNRFSETSSTENNYSQYNYSRNKFNGCKDNNYVNKDKYETSQSHRWHISPDRSCYRGGRNYTDEYYKRYDYNTRRTLDSPPREKSYHQSRSRDHRPNHNRHRSQDPLRARNDNERYAEKHKFQDDLDEPSYKRQKFEYTHRHTEDNSRWHIDVSKGAGPEPSEFTELISCQSPDYVYSDYNFTIAPIREIRNTAVMHLEDPRLTSKKYKIINGGDKEILSTVIGRNVDIIPVNKNIWGFKPIPMPKALLQPPSVYADNMDRNIYMGIDNPSSKVDAGDISGQTSDSQHRLGCNMSDGLVTSMNDETPKSTTSDHKQIVNNINHDKTSNCQTIKKHGGNNISVNTLESRYKISKLQNSAEVPTRNIETGLNDNEKSNIDLGKQQESMKKGNENNIPVEIKSMPHLNIPSECSIDVNIVNNRENSCDSNLKKINDGVKNYNENKHYELAISTIVETDLILSDDASDIVEPEQKLTKHTNKICKRNKVEEYIENIDVALETIKKIESETVIEHSKKHKRRKKSYESEGSDTVHSKNNKIVESTKNQNVDQKKCLSDIDTYIGVLENAKKVASEDKVKISNKETSAEHLKKRKSRKNSEESKECDVDQTQKNIVEECTKKQKYDQKKCLTDINTDSGVHFENIEKIAPEDKNETKNIETPAEHAKKRKSRKKSKVDKTQKSKKEKDTKTQERNNKFTDLFGDSNSLITPDDLGIVTCENELRAKHTVFEDIHDTVDLNIKEMEKLKPRICSPQKDSVSEQTEISCPLNAKSDCSPIIDSNCEDLKLNVNKKMEENSSIVKENTDVTKIYENISSETPDIVKTIIISTGCQPQCVPNSDMEFTQPQNVVSHESVDKSINRLAVKALATSTPAKMLQGQTLTNPAVLLQNCSSTSRELDRTPTIDQSSDIDSQKDVDVPDVRIFVKRRRKVKKVTL